MLDLPCRIPLDPRDSSASQTLEHVAFGYMYYVVPAPPLGSWLVLCSLKCGDVDVKFGASPKLQSKTAGGGGQICRRTGHTTPVEANGGKRESTPTGLGWSSF